MSYCSFLWGKKGERPFLFQVKEIRRGRGTRQSDGLLICPMYVKSLSINIYHFLGCFFLSSVGLFTQKMYCSLYYVHSTHNPTIFASSRVNQHLYKYDNVRCELFFYFRFLPEPNQVQKTLYYLFWRNMYLFWHYIHLYWHHVKWPDWTRSIPGHPSQTQVRYPSTSSHVISFFQFEFPHNLNH